MRILMLEKIGTTLFGCIDDGVHYHVISVERGGVLSVEKSYYSGNYKSYEDFVFCFAETDPAAYFLEGPVTVGASRLDDLSYEYLLAVWEQIWMA